VLSSRRVFSGRNVPIDICIKHVECFFRRDSVYNHDNNDDGSDVISEEFESSDDEDDNDVVVADD
jgi:hypothetical protein